MIVWLLTLLLFIDGNYCHGWSYYKNGLIAVSDNRLLHGNNNNYRYCKHLSYDAFACCTRSVVIPRKSFFSVANHRTSRENNLLYSTNKNDDEVATTKNQDKTCPSNDSNKRINSVETISVLLSRIDSLLVYTDIFAIVIACQLMGLIDVLNDATFWMNGGWFQPIIMKSASTTLPMFVQRFAINTVCYTTITLTFVKGSYEIGTSLQSSKSILQMMVSSITTFTFIRLGLWYLGFLIFLSQPTATATNEQIDYFGIIMNHSGEFTEVLRECYFVGITTTIGRLTVHKLLQ